MFFFGEKICLLSVIGQFDEVWGRGVVTGVTGGKTEVKYNNWLSVQVRRIDVDTDAQYLRINFVTLWFRFLLLNASMQPVRGL